MEFDTQERTDATDAIMEEQISMSNLMESRAAQVREGITVGMHEKDLTLTDPDTGVVRMADINNKDDMELLAAQRSGGADLNEKKWDPNDPDAADFNVLYGRGTNKPKDPERMGFHGKILGIWPPNPSTMVDFFLAHEAKLKAEGMQALISIYLTDTSPLVLSIRGYKQPFSCTSLETYACLFGYMMLMGQGASAPNDDELDAMAKGLDVPGAEPYTYLLFGQRALQLTMPQLEVYARDMFRFKAEMNAEGVDEEKKKVATVNYNQRVEFVTKAVFETMVYYGMGGGAEFSAEQMALCGTYAFSVLADSEIARIATERGQLADEQPPVETETPIVNIRISARPTPAWFRTAWASVCSAMGFKSPMSVPDELPVWIDESVLIAVLHRMVLFYYFNKRGVESNKFLRDVIIPFYNMIKIGGAAAATPEVCVHLTKESVWTTQRTLQLLEECVLRMLAPVYHFNDTHRNTVAESAYDPIMMSKEKKTVVEWFKEGQENVKRSDMWHLHFVPVTHCSVEKKICLESCIELCRGDPDISKHITPLIEKLSNDENYGTAAWVPSALYVVFAALSDNICNQALLSKDAAAKSRVEEFYKNCKRKLFDTLPVKKLVEELIEMKKQEDAEKMETEASTHKRRAEDEAVTPTEDEGHGNSDVTVEDAVMEE